ncbi:MAG: glycosyltransferase family 4 protein [Acidobacteria bacterium]|nr:glycosyltransferase family 4 protein [Acidobacteriota bacterium]
MKRVAILCEVLHPPLDEGVRIFAAEIGAAMSRRREVLLLGELDAEVKGMAVHGVLRDRFFVGSALSRSIASFAPEGIVYIPWTSLTPRTFLRTAVLRRRAPSARLGVVALQPRDPGWLMRVGARLGPPDRLFALGPSVAALSARLGLASTRLEGGVDTARFRPLGDASKSALRRSLGLPASAYIALHVGHLKEARGVLALKSIQAIPGMQALLVTSTSTQGDADVRRELQQAGVRVVDRHLADIEEHYRASDCYVFPVHSSLDAIELPLSILEAMATNLPIVTTRFGGVPALLDGAGAGVVFFESEAELPRAVLGMRQDRPAPELRRRLERLTWDGMAEQIVKSLEAAVPAPPASREARA